MAARSRYYTSMPLRRLRLLVALAAVLGVAAAAPATAGAFDKAFWGPVTVNGQSQFPIYKDLGVSIFQIQLDWNVIATQGRPANPSDPNDPTYRWPPEVDQAIAEAQANGMSVALMIFGAPGWANGEHTFRYAPKDPNDYAAFALAAARRYPAVHRWLIWGEPNRFENFQPLTTQHLGSLKLTPGQARGPKTYARLLDAAYVALKGESRQNIVIGGNTTTAGTLNPYSFAKYLTLPNGKHARFDQWGHNPFSARRPSFTNPPSPHRFADFSDLKRYSQFLDDEFGRHIKIFLSEWTIPTDREDKEFNFWVSQDTQARWISAGLRLARSFRRISGLGWIHLYDEPPDSSGRPVVQGGLIQADGTRKPGYDAFKNG
jgi:hypothetical protein